VDEQKQQQILDLIQRTVAEVTGAWAKDIGPRLIRRLGQANESSALPLEFLEIRVYGDRMSVRSVASPLSKDAQMSIDKEVASFEISLKKLT
jgi:hypothetical protein